MYRINLLGVILSDWSLILPDHKTLHLSAVIDISLGLITVNTFCADDEVFAGFCLAGCFFVLGLLIFWGGFGDFFLGGWGGGVQYFGLSSQGKVSKHCTFERLSANVCEVYFVSVFDLWSGLSV